MNNFLLTFPTKYIKIWTQFFKKKKNSEENLRKNRIIWVLLGEIRQRLDVLMAFFLRTEERRAISALNLSQGFQNALICRTKPTSTWRHLANAGRSLLSDSWRESGNQACALPSSTSFDGSISVLIQGECIEVSRHRRALLKCIIRCVFAVLDHLRKGLIFSLFRPRSSFD